MIKVGDKLPNGTLRNTSTSKATVARSDRILSTSRHLRQDDRDLRPAGRVHADLLGQARARLCRHRQAEGRGVDEIWCVSVNDAFVMGAWGRDQKTAGKLRMMADGSAEFAKATGLTLDLTRAAAWACARTATRCWSTTASSRRSTSRRRASSRSATPRRCCAQAKEVLA